MRDEGGELAQEIRLHVLLAQQDRHAIRQAGDEPTEMNLLDVEDIGREVAQLALDRVGECGQVIAGDHGRPAGEHVAREPRPPLGRDWDVLNAVAAGVCWLLTPPRRDDTDLHASGDETL